MSHRVKLFCIPFAGGNMAAYQSLIPRVKADLVTLELPGRGRRFTEPLLDSTKAQVQDLMAQITPQLRQPYAIYGHSMGSLLTYLLTIELLKAQYPAPAHLFVSGRGAPHFGPSYIRHRLPSADFWKEIEELGGSPREVMENKDLRDLVEPILRADFKALETYTHLTTMALPVPLTTFYGEDDKPTLEEMEAWKDYTAREMQLKPFPGGHFFINERPDDVAAMFNEVLGRL